MTGQQPQTVLAAVRRRRFLVTGWPWRALAYLLTTPAASVAALPLLLLGAPWLVLLIRLAEGDYRPVGALVLLGLLGAGLLAVFGPLVAAPVAALERVRLRLVDSRPVPPGFPDLRAGSGELRSWLRACYAAPAAWRGLAYACLLVTVAPLAYGLAALLLALQVALLASPWLASAQEPVSLAVGVVHTRAEAVPYALAGAVLLPAVPYGLALLAGAHGALARMLLGGGSQARLRAKLVDVSRSRARLVDGFEAERRRIERDLHDGAQQRLVGLTLQLGLARLDLPPGSPAEAAVTKVHQQAKELMAELRELIHGIHPKALTDQGLPAALRELADRCPVPVAVSADLPGRLPRHVETTGYFVVAEAVANATKHSGAARVQVTACRHAGSLVIEVRDDGRGGAEPGTPGGSGLTGLADRVAVVDGRMFLSSPRGGPTVLRVELPCRENPPG